MTRLVLTMIGDRTRGVVGMSRRTLAGLGLAAGDTVQLEGRRATLARVIPSAVPEDGLAIDEEMLGNLGAQAGDSVEVARGSADPLDTVLLDTGQGRPPSPAELEDALFDRVLTVGDQLSIPVRGRICEARVVASEPRAQGQVTAGTTISVQSRPAPIDGYDSVAGLDAQIAKVHDIIALPLSRPDLFRHLGVSPPRGVLFCGPPGSGKTLLARSVAARTRAAFFQIDAPEIVSKHYGDSEAALRKVFAAAEKAQPAIVFIDEIDAIAPQRGDLSAEKQVERRVVAQLLTLMDGLSDRGRVVVMAATNMPDSLDPALRRPGRFDREVAFTAPGRADRAAILALHLKDAPLDASVDIEDVARRAHGYVGADLAALAREAAMAALARSVAEAGSEDAVSLQGLVVTQTDLDAGLARTSPSILRSEEEPDRPIAWSEIGGLEPEKTALRQAVLWPRRHGASLERLGLRAPRGVLMTGPPGSGKTLAARALANEGDMTFIPVRPATLLSQFLGEAERAVARLFDKARHAAPCLLFFDEFDALAPRRGGQDAVFDRIVAQLLVELDGMAGNPGVSLLAATNRAAAIDPALLRPGRFDRIVRFPMPDADARAAILAVHLRDRPLDSDVDCEVLAHGTEGFSGADLAGLADGAAWRALARAAEQGGAARIVQADLVAAADDHRAAQHARSVDHIAGHAKKETA